MTPITDDEIQMLDSCGLTRGKAPFIISGTGSGIFSVARHYGGMRFDGHHYTYCPDDDSLYRDDVLKWLAKIRKPAKQEQPEKKQLDIFGD